MKVKPPKSELLLPYAGKWVALSPNGKRVIAFGLKAEVVVKRLEKMKIKRNEAIFLYVPPLDAYLSMRCH